MEKSITYRRVVDLTHPIRPGIPIWPGDPPVEFEVVASIAENGYALRRFSMGEHSGTHLATPSSLWPDGAEPDQIPVEQLVADAVVIDASGVAQRNPDYTLGADKVLEWEERHGRFPASSVALLCAGWSHYWDDLERFINADAQGIMHFPGFGIDAARLLLEKRGVAGLGIDTHGIDAGADGSLSVSRFALGQNALALECLNNLNQLPPTGATLVIGRLPLVGGSGSPVSVLALIP